MNVNDYISPVLPLGYWLQIHAVASLIIAASLFWMLVRGFEIRRSTLASAIMSLVLRGTVWLIAVTAIASAGASSSSGAAALPVNVIQDALFAVVMIWVVVSHEKFIAK
jgi:hypothetical protein